MISNLGVLPNNAMTGNLTSRSFTIRFGFSLQALWTGTPIGVLQIQISNDRLDPDSWTDVIDSKQITGGVAGSHIFDFPTNSTRVKFARLVYTHTSGTGALTLNKGPQGGEVYENIL